MAAAAGGVPATMKAVAVGAKAELKAGAPEQLYVDDAVPVPAVGAGEILIRIHATALNRADTLQRKGSYNPPPGASAILGLECAGEVVALAPDVKRWQKGDRVMALLAGGGYAQYTAVNADCAMPIPAAMPYTTAAAIPETFVTAYQILVLIGGLKAGETVLIHAGASGVGTSAIQLCGLLGAHAIVTAGSDDKLKACAALGAEFGVNYKTSADFAAPILAHLKSRTTAPAAAGVDVVLDCVGASYALQNLAVLKPADGRWVLYGTMGGATVDKFPLNLILAKRVSLMGTTLRARPVAYKAQLIASFSAAALSHFADAKAPAGGGADKAGAAAAAGAGAGAGAGGGMRLAPVIDRVYSGGLADVVAAHQRMDADANTGKIVLTVNH